MRSAAASVVAWLAACRRSSSSSSTGRLKNRDKILERVGRLKGRFPKARPFVTITVSKAKRAELSWSWNVGEVQGGPGP